MPNVQVKRKWLREDVGGLVLAGNPLENDVATSHAFANEMVLNVNVFRTRMVSWVLRNGDGSLIVIVDNGGTSLRIA